MNNTKPAIFIFDVKIHDAAALQPYLESVESTYKAFGGKRIVFGDHVEVIEGQAPQGRVVMLQFDSLETAHAWHASPEYQALIPIRQAGSETNTWLVEAVDEQNQ